QAPLALLRSPTARCSASTCPRMRARASLRSAAAAAACSSKSTGAAVRTSNPNRSSRAAPVASPCWPLESTCTSASLRQIVPNSPRLPVSPVSLLRTIPALTDSLPLLDAHRGTRAARPDDGPHRPRVPVWSSRYAVVPGWEEVSEQIAEALVTAMALGTAIINLAAAIIRLAETERPRDEPRVRDGRHR